MNRIMPSIYPMLYSFFCVTGLLKLEPFLTQVDAVIAAGRTRISILGFGTEVGKLSFEDRATVLTLMCNRIAGRCQLMVTVYGDTSDEQVAFANIVMDHCVSWLVLQPPSLHCNEEDLSLHVSKIMSNGPFAVGIQNGRCGLEFPDSLRDGVVEIVPGIDTADKHEQTHALFASGNLTGADTEHSQISPIISFIVQGILHFLTYGRTIAALRLGIDVGGSRQPHLSATPFGRSIAKRFATQLGPLAY